MYTNETTPTTIFMFEQASGWRIGDLPGYTLEYGQKPCLSRLAVVDRLGPSIHFVQCNQ